jgi:site-specific DNA-methyltransferase (adenine-specific)
MTLLKGNCLETLKTLETASVDSIVTDPPYELGFMGKAWDNSGIAYNQNLWAECLRVLKPGGHLLAFSGSRTYHRMVVAIEDSGFEIRDQIMWLYGSGFPKSHNLKDEWQGWGTALKPAHEPIVVARKPLIGTVANNVLTYGTGALNIDGSRVGTETVVTTNGKGFNGSFEGGTNNNGGAEREGRWPANVIHDGSDEVLAGFPESKSGKAGIRTSDGFNNGVYGNGMGIKAGQPNGEYGDSGSAARFFYCAKASKSERNAGTDGANNHPTVKPLALMRYLVKLVTPPGGIVLDPFLGSGTTAMAAVMEGFDWVGCEMTEDYWPIIEARVEWAKNQQQPML